MNGMIIIAEYNEMVNNVERIVREARHMNVGSVYPWLANAVVGHLNSVYGQDVDEDTVADVLSEIALDVLDAVKDAMDDDNCKEGSNEFIVLNSVYDAVHDFYFE